MIIQNLLLENFRNYSKEEIKFSNSLNFFIGKNASGKTNLIEAIGYFVLYRSFRGISDIDLINYNANHFYLKIDVLNKYQTNQYEIGVHKNNNTLRKKIKKNGKKIQKISSIISDVIGVFFTPDDIELIESLSKRRNFFDYIFSLIDQDYFNILLEYQKCLKQRNELLKRILEKKAHVSELDFWDEKIIQNSIIIMNKRKQYVERYKSYLYKRIADISENQDSISLELEQDDYTFKEKFIENRYKDIYAGTTTIGIHRDKMLLLDKKNKDIQTSFSQGQKRTVSISLKLAQYDILLEIFKIKPILFIDDVIRELDQYRRKYFLKLLIDCGQAFFTTPNFEDDMKMFKQINGSNCKIFEISQGKIVNEF